MHEAPGGAAFRQEKGSKEGSDVSAKGSEG
jgi:hypothetical protein